MADVTFTQGKMLDFEAQIEFGLNFENIRTSIKIPIGDLVQYDGENIKYTKKDGSIISGINRYLKSAVKNDWLTLKGTKAPTAPSMVSDPITAAKQEGKDYDEFKGGSFETFVKKGMGITKEEDNVVKIMDLKKPADKPPVVVNEKKVTTDQVPVADIGNTEYKERLIVGSSTVVERHKKHSKVIKASDAYGSEGSITLKSQKAISADKKKKPYIVDHTTAKPPEEATLKEVRKVTEVINSEEYQDAVVVKKIGTGKEVIPMDGEVIKTADDQEATVIKTMKPIVVDGEVIKTADNQEATVIKTIKPIVVDVGEEKIIDGITFKKTKSVEKGPEATVGATPVMSVPTAVVGKAASGPLNYMELLPEDWGKSHWTKKEKFVKALTDKAFLKFILRVESIKAIQDACKARMLELDAK